MTPASKLLRINVCLRRHDIAGYTYDRARLGRKTTFKGSRSRIKGEQALLVVFRSVSCIIFVVSGRFLVPRS